MSKRYTGNFISGVPQTPTLTSNNGVFDVKDVYTATSNNTWQEADGYYEIPRSLRIRSSASTYLNRIPATSSNRTTWTWSAWVKWTGVASQLFGVTSGSGNSSTQEDNRLAIQLGGDGQFQFYEFASATFSSRKYSAARMKDPSAWYHLMVSVDYTKSIADDRIKMYVNGVQLNTFESVTTPSQNLTSYMNGSGNNHTIGGQIKQYNNFYDGHITEMYLVDGQQLDPSYFGYFDAVTNIWQPKPYTGSYGTNGFYLPFTENQTTTNLGRNRAGSNYLSYSEALNSWSAAISAITCTANTVAGPFDTGSATTADTLNLANGYYTQNTATTIAGTTYCFSMWMRTDSGTKQIQLQEVNGGGGGQVFTVTTQWQRFWITTSSANSALMVGVDQRFGGSASTSGVLYCWGAQVNLGTTPDPYVATGSAGINNDWTPNNFSLTPGVTYDSMVDSPTNVFTTATDVGGVVSGNYATLNVVDQAGGFIQSGSLNWGSSSVTANGGNSSGFRSTIGVATGKWYAEFTKLATSTNGQPPKVGTSDIVIGTYNGYLALTGGNNSLPSSTSIDAGYDYTRVIGVKVGSTTAANTDTGVTFTTGDVLGYALDCDARTLIVYKNGSQVGSTLSWSGTVPSTPLHFYGSQYQSWDTPCWAANFGQRQFAYTPPAGFKSLNTTNLQALGTSVTTNAAVQPYKWFDVTTYAGTGTVSNITNSGFQPDLVWVKIRNTTYSHRLMDSVRGPNSMLFSDLLNPENASTTDGLMSFNSNGFTLGVNTQSPGYALNEAGSRFVAWQWKQSAASGFNVIPYTGTGSAQTISHNLGVTPAMVIVKNRTGASRQWSVYHKSIPNSQNGGIYFNLTNVWNSDSTLFNNTAPTSSNITIGTYYSVAGETGVIYAFAEVPGFSKFGSYIGNGSTDGPFVYCGFKPKFILMKDISVAGSWIIQDSVRTPNNPSNTFLQANTTIADYTYSGADIDFVSNGFKIRGTDGDRNGSYTYIYAAFAESPFALNNRAR